MIKLPLFIVYYHDLAVTNKPSMSPPAAHIIAKGGVKCLFSNNISSPTSVIVIRILR